ncbi:phosphatidic acid phosphatase type 2/haloperoxidase [Diplogelasinospora grovesii]|uniref:Dolichyldiphosphatase n=1 Tax=Diplogelasinospora grovesii TaxID=303347 RepID=A0AAN6N319_9PEZI|nr:phosphatidic acid phosphatase type 2/haloperoxidase [Diplogelasinospora grovesii]
MADDVSPLASLSLTHVYYNPDDPISYLCAWLALVPQALCIVYATLLWSSREAEVALMFAGQLACEAVNFALKRMIKEERPRRIHATGKGYGMPSSHAQFVFFWAIALALFLLVRHSPTSSSKPQPPSSSTPSSTPSSIPAHTPTPSPPQDVTPTWVAKVERYAHQPWSLLERSLASLCALVLAALVAWSRIYLGYHTPRQVLVGCVAGILSAVGWFGITYIVRRAGLLQWALELPPARWLRIRDLAVEEDLCQAGWEKWEVRRTLKRLKKKKKKTT